MIAIVWDVAGVKMSYNELFKLVRMTRKKYQYFLILHGNVCNLFWKIRSLNEENFNSRRRERSANSL